MKLGGAEHSTVAKLGRELVQLDELVGPERLESITLAFPDTDGSASHCHSWDALDRFLSPSRIFPVHCSWSILSGKSLSECFSKGRTDATAVGRQMEKKKLNAVVSCNMRRTALLRY